jgi:hypothetical protein
MKGKKPARKFGGRPVKREPELGKRTHLSLAVPLTLKREIEKAAAKRGWSVSSEATRRLQLSFEYDLLRAAQEADETVLKDDYRQMRDEARAAVAEMRVLLGKARK